jgi:hypothetical protein
MAYALGLGFSLLEDEGSSPSFDNFVFLFEKYVVCFYNIGEMTERLKVVDCKSINLFLRRFESYFLQIFSRFYSKLKKDYETFLVMYEIANFNKRVQISP